MNSADVFYNNKRMSDEFSWVNEGLERPESASKRLQAYIKQYDEERTPKETPFSGCYVSSAVSSLLSSKPKAASGEFIQLSKEGMNDNLVKWVNASYAKDLHRKVLPYGSGSTSSIPNKLREIEDDDSNDDDDVQSVWSDPGLSTLPSPGSSVVSDLDTNVGSESTDKLLKSFYKKQNIKQGPPSKNYPSWVEHISQEDYPSWLDDIDKTQLAHNFNVTHESSRNRLSRSLSPTFFHHYPIPSTANHNIPAKTRAVKNEAWELESIDTEVLVSQPIYGNQPVNMGGSLHTKLYRDKKIEKLYEQSFRKIAKKPQKESTPIRSGTLAKSRKNNEIMRISSVKTNTRIPYSATSATYRPYSSYPRYSNDSPSKTWEQRPQVKSFTPVHKPSRAMRNLKLSLQERKQSAESNDTDKLMRLSPTGIRLDKTDENHPSTASKSKILRKGFDNARPPKGKLTKLIQSNSSQNEKWTKRSPENEKDNILGYISATKLYQNRRNDTPGYRPPADEYRRKSPTGIFARTLSPREITRSVPRMRSVTVPGSDLLAERLHQMSLTDRRKWPRGSRLNTRRQDTDSVTTETLVVHPPMPIFDASPSLTTETASSTISEDSGDTLVEQEALETSFLYEGTGERAGMTPSSRADVIETPREWYQDYDNYPSRTILSEKPGIITSFLDDCLRSSQESDVGTSVSERASPTISNDCSERPVETLKKLLFTVQNLTKSSEEDNPDDLGSEDSATENDRSTCTGNESREVLSDINSGDIPEGNNSLSRAYYHLSRLKKLVSVSQQVAASK